MIPVWVQQMQTIFRDNLVNDPPIPVSISSVQTIFTWIAHTVRFYPNDNLIPVRSVHDDIDTMGAVILAIKGSGTLEYGLKDFLSIETFNVISEVKPTDLYRQRIFNARDQLAQGNRECWYLMCRRIVEDYILHGKPSWDSDVDLLIVMPFKGRPNRQAVEIRSRIDTPVALDLLVRTPQQVSQRLAMGDTFMCDILERGEVVYEAHN